MSAPHTDTAARRRAWVTLGSVLVAGLVLLGAVVAVLVARHSTPPPPPGTAVPEPTSAPVPGDSEEQALAARPMPLLPPAAAQPQPLAPTGGGAALRVPAPAGDTGAWIPSGFPATPEGALGQLRALDEAAVSGADPEVFARGYRENAEPGAPDPAATGLAAVLRSLRSRASLPGTGPVPGLVARFQVTHGLIKGTGSAGRFVVVCVLGQLSVGVGGRVVSAGVGDCQAMRWSGTRWRVASGPLAAPAPSAWPGSADAVRAGYRELS
ncbi:hypothetical protein [Actinokineospora bangkokensis]|uniref:Uncharacterized protein n=1 Tax=Actinokineospora bangkokensis TaxID=1193682 RepID=A0A1Q9LKM1_9PSEU|nr:hypothetical protein [Actinokineospora bangkokensis]OLR92582.1 hypothetical protein BJP25_21255 [Actinokineospora bangkokensis]